MPRYEYFCLTCDEVKIHTHSWKEKIETCLDCNTDKIDRIVSTIKLKQETKTKNQPKVGEVVKRSIKDAKAELEKDKKDRKNNR